MQILLNENEPCLTEWAIKRHECEAKKVEQHAARETDQNEHAAGTAGRRAGYSD